MSGTRFCGLRRQWSRTHAQKTENCRRGTGVKTALVNKAARKPTNGRGYWDGTTRLIVYGAVDISSGRRKEGGVKEIYKCTAPVVPQRSQAATPRHSLSPDRSVRPNADGRCDILILLLVRLIQQNF
ncbi:hypothetical protein ACJJTC_007124 [Scirpophaga incertulas]